MKKVIISLILVILVVLGLLVTCGEETGISESVTSFWDKLKDKFSDDEPDDTVIEIRTEKIDEVPVVEELVVNEPEPVVKVAVEPEVVMVEDVPEVEVLPEEVEEVFEDVPEEVAEVVEEPVKDIEETFEEYRASVADSSADFVAPVNKEAPVVAETKAETLKSDPLVTYFTVYDGVEDFEEDEVSYETIDEDEPVVEEPIIEEPIEVEPVEDEPVEEVEPEETFVAEAVEEIEVEKTEVAEDPIVEYRLREPGIQFGFGAEFTRFDHYGFDVDAMKYSMPVSYNVPFGRSMVASVYLTPAYFDVTDCEDGYEKLEDSFSLSAGAGIGYMSKKKKFETKLNLGVEFMNRGTAVIENPTGLLNVGLIPSIRLGKSNLWLSVPVEGSFKFNDGSDDINYGVAGGLYITYRQSEGK